MTDKAVTLTKGALMAAMAFTDGLGESVMKVIFPIFPDDEWTAQFVLAADFVKLAGGASGEAVYRWMAMQQMHAMPVAGYAKIDPGLRLFFDGFATVVTAARPLLFPEEGLRPIIPAQYDVDPHDKIFDKAGRIDDRIGDGRGPQTTADVPVYVPPARRAETVAAMLAAEGRTIVGRQEPEEMGMPSPAEMASMSPEERRQYLHLDPRFADPAIVTQAPSLEGFTREDVRTAVGVGTILVPPGRSAPHGGLEAGGGAPIRRAAATGIPSVPPHGKEYSPSDGEPPLSVAEGGAGELSPPSPAPDVSRKGAKR